MNAISWDPIIFPCGMSRSGTTLLTTILDSHSQVFMGYELLPTLFPDVDELLALLKEGMIQSGGDFSRCGKILKDCGARMEGLFFVRCHRAGIDAADIETLLNRYLVKRKSIETIDDRFEIAWMISKRNAEKHSANRYGFKINAPSFDRAITLFPAARLVYILRDPRDVVASHISRKFDRTIETICRAWNNYLDAFETSIEIHSDKCLLIKYEDLVTNPKSIIPRIMEKLSLEVESSLYRFYNSKAGVHSFGHPNNESLKKGFFTTSIRRWENELPCDHIHEIEARCKDKMSRFGYV